MLRLVKIALLGMVLAVSGTAYSQTNSQGYNELNTVIPTANPDKIEVLEFFWFGCPHCFRFEPTINEWAATKPDYVDFVREAPPLNPGWLPHSQAYYASQVLDVTDKFFDAFFHAIHTERKRLNKPEAIAEWAGTLGIDSELFLKTMNSFEVDMRIRRAMKLAQSAGIRSVPSMLVNGKYTTSGSVAGSNQNVIKVINNLVGQEHTTG